MARLSTADAFIRAQGIRDDWESGAYPTKASLSRKYGVSESYIKKILNGEKCKDIAPPEGEYKDVMLHGVKYAVYRDGRIWSYTKNFLLSFSRKTYQIFHVYDSAGIRHKVRVHVLVLTTFGAKRPKGCRLVRHLNDIRWDNRFENLAWGNDGDNTRDKIRNGNQPVGVDISTAKLNDKIVTKIRLTYDGVGSPVDHCLSIVNALGIEMTRKGVSFVISDRGWKHLNLPACVEGTDNTGITKHERKLIMKNFKRFGDKFESKTKFARAFARSLSNTLGRQVHHASVLRVLA